LPGVDSPLDHVMRRVLRAIEEPGENYAAHSTTA
jgi:hypothetical protein